MINFLSSCIYFTGMLVCFYYLILKPLKSYKVEWFFNKVIGKITSEILMKSVVVLFDGQNFFILSET